MKYDLIKNSNNELESEEKLNEEEVALITLLNNQDLPELDGLNVESVSIETDENNKRHLIIEARNYHKDYFELTIFDHTLIIVQYNDAFKLTLKTDDKNNLVSYGCNYIYGDDVISFEKSTSDTNKSWECVTAKFYLNAQKERYESPMEDGLPIDLIPNYEQRFNKLPNGCFDISASIPSIEDLDIEKNPNEIITRWRQVCKVSCDLYRQFRYESISPREK